MPVFNFVRTSLYRDSVALMRLSRDLEEIPGVAAAAAMMATEANRARLQEAGLLAPEGAAAAPSDLLVAVAADTRQAADAARQAVERALVASAAPRPGAAAVRPRTLATALRRLPEANVALVSVPGPYAAMEAARALCAGLHVMVFSDNVPVAAEVELKRAALARGRLLMGPDCGTAILDGVPLGFANAVPRGRIGFAAASGTGLQEITCLIAREGEGVSQAIGVGGRDLSDEVGGLMMLHALDLLAADADTAVVCLLGKRPGAAVTARLADAVARAGKPCVACFPGSPGVVAGAVVALTLEDAGRAAVALARGTAPPAPAPTSEALASLAAGAARELGAGARFVRGVFAGGTLASEAAGLLAERLDDVAPSLTTGGPGHRVHDLGDDRFTLGRPHPMLDGHVRRQWVEREGRDPATAVLLLDVILGHNTAADPAGEVLPALRAVRRARPVAVVASVCGTEDDRPPRSAQAALLRDAGVLVMDTNAQAARLAALIARHAGAPGR